MKTFFNNHEGFSIKDLYGILFTILFIGSAVYAITTDWKEHRETAMQVLSIVSPIILTIVGGYAVTEGTRSVVHTWNNRSTNSDTQIQNKTDQEGQI